MLSQQLQMQTVLLSAPWSDKIKELNLNFEELVPLKSHLGNIVYPHN